MPPKSQSSAYSYNTAFGDLSSGTPTITDRTRNQYYLPCSLSWSSSVLVVMVALPDRWYSCYGKEMFYNGRECSINYGTLSERLALSVEAAHRYYCWHML